MEIDPIIDKTVEELHEKLHAPDIVAEAKKVSQKMVEARYNPGDVTPLADCIVAILLAARGQGFSAGTVMNAVKRICESLAGKEWKRMPDGTYRAQ